MKFKVAGIVVLLILFISGCSGESTTEEMYKHLEEAVSLESEFVSQQQPLTELEEEEQTIYQEISKLSMDEFEQITSLADQALDSIEQRMDILEKEKNSIDAAKEEFDKIDPLIEDLEDEQLKKKAKEMKQAMNDRYKAYISLYEAYKTSLNYDQELYQLLKQEELKEDALSEQIEKVNTQYEKVVEANDVFNEKTDVFNNKKRAFYESTDLNISYEENE
ncbi:Putative cell-wall binding lipoprotein [Paraliobacillus sp. PM-2]|uniref:YkyA family protein n=1 Tax=Paraliobacillus sp. PM-2 TaxID=1462524 RepID=UPI00061BAF52|nr:YkyA family protein [Paraliobacillus sp. PM-2]CQR47836.1 Putative cell-wall binding lipoprotein [Paraliobacillus sp. PM-2]